MYSMTVQSIYIFTAFSLSVWSSPTDDILAMDVAILLINGACCRYWMYPLRVIHLWYILYMISINYDFPLIINLCCMSFMLDLWKYTNGKVNLWCIQCVLYILLITDKYYTWFNAWFVLNRWLVRHATYLFICLSINMHSMSADIYCCYYDCAVLDDLFTYTRYRYMVHTVHAITRWCVYATYVLIHDTCYQLMYILQICTCYRLIMHMLHDIDLSCSLAWHRSLMHANDYTD